MYNDYDDDYIEPEKNAEFREAIDTLIDEELKSRDEEKHLRLVSAEERAEKYSKLYYASEAEKRQSENKHKAELETTIKETRKSTLKELTQGFTAGDSVFVRISEGHRHKCAVCGGSGDIQAIFEDVRVKASCPHCRYGWIDDPDTYIVKKDTITHATYYAYFDTRERKLTIRNPEFRLDDRDGTFLAERIFSTKEEAESGERVIPTDT